MFCKKPITLKKHIWILGLILALFGVFIYSGRILHKSIESSSTGQVASKNTIAVLQDNPDLALWAEKLGKMENCPVLGKVDTNGKKSYGRYCFQLKTFQHFSKKFNILPYADEADLENMVGDQWAQEKIILALYENKLPIEPLWRTSITKKKLGLP